MVFKRLQKNETLTGITEWSEPSRCTLTNSEVGSTTVLTDDTEKIKDKRSKIKDHRSPLAVCSLVVRLAETRLVVHNSAVLAVRGRGGSGEG